MTTQLLPFIELYKVVLTISGQVLYNFSDQRQREIDANISTTVPFSKRTKALSYVVIILPNMIESKEPLALFLAKRNSGFYY